MYAGLALLFTAPAVTEFFRLEWPPADLFAASVMAAVAGSLAVEAIGFLQRSRTSPTSGDLRK
jgi:cation-transporting ATPase E